MDSSKITSEEIGIYSAALTAGQIQNEVSRQIDNALQPLFGEDAQTIPENLPFHLAWVLLATRGRNGTLTISRAGWPEERQFRLGWAFGTIRQFSVNDGEEKIDANFILRQDDLVATDWYAMLDVVG